MRALRPHDPRRGTPDRPQVKKRAIFIFCCFFSDWLGKTDRLTVSTALSKLQTEEVFKLRTEEVFKLQIEGLFKLRQDGVFKFQPNQGRLEQRLFFVCRPLSAAAFTATKAVT